VRNNLTLDTSYFTSRLK